MLPARRASLISGSICSKSIFNLRKAAALYSELEAKIILSFICSEVSPLHSNLPLSMIAALFYECFALSSQNYISLAKREAKVEQIYICQRLLQIPLILLS